LTGRNLLEGYPGTRQHTCERLLYISTFERAGRKLPLDEIVRKDHIDTRLPRDLGQSLRQAQTTSGKVNRLTDGRRSQSNGEKRERARDEP
jgi:hypothetical protein